MSAKDTSTYWKSRITRRKIRGVESSNYYARLSHDKKQAWINLDTGNATKAANKAAKTWSLLKSEGWESVKPTKENGDSLTVGQYIKAVEDSNILRESTRKSYVRKLRQLAGEIKGLCSDKSRFAANKSAEWVKKIDNVKLSDLTDENVKKWKTRRIHGITDPIAKAKAETTRDSILRNAKSLFGHKVLDALTVNFKQVPLVSVKVNAMKKTKFEPETDFDEVIKNAANDFEKEQDLHLIFLLAASCGLRRSEIDRLRQEDINMKEGTITITDTADGLTKTTNSKRTINISTDSLIYSALKDLKLGFYVVAPSQKLANKRKAESYRCEALFAKLTVWLRGQGINKAEQPIHYLRKACGDRLTRTHGIAVAANTLGDSMQMAHAVYSDHKNTKAI